MHQSAVPSADRRADRPPARGRGYRLGFLVPSSNTCLEPVVSHLLRAAEPQLAATAHFARVTVTRIALDGDSDAQFDPAPMLAAARQLADAQVDVIVWGGTSGTWLGLDRDRALCAAIEAGTGIPATTSALALFEAYAAFGVTRLGLAVPYTEDVAARIVDIHWPEGIDVTALDHLDISDNEAFGRVGVEQVAKQLAAVAPGAHATAVVCTNVHGARLAEAVEAETGAPVLDSVTATVWHALDLVGARPAVPGWGALLRSGSLRARCARVVADLLAATGADRTTLRLDLPHLDLGVDLTTAEALAPGVRSIRHDASLDQRALTTVRWMEEHRAPLVQPHFRAEPEPPQALVEVYGVKAQTLGPIVSGPDMVGWLSVHSTTEREWSTADLQALERATDQVRELLDHPAYRPSYQPSHQGKKEKQA